MLSIGRLIISGPYWVIVLRLLVLGVFFGSVILGIFQEFWLPFFFGRISVFTLSSICLVFLLSDLKLNGLGIYTNLQSILLALLYSNSFVWTYELIYHFSFPSYWNLASIASETIIFVQLVPILFLARYMNRRSMLALVSGSIFVAIWVFWIAAGFPQYWHLDPYFGGYLIRLPNIYWDSFALDYSSKLALMGTFVGLMIPQEDDGMKFLLRPTKV